MGDDDLSKRKGKALSCSPAKDGRLHISVSLSAVVSPAKFTFCAVVAVVIMCYLIAPYFGMQSLQTRVFELEAKLSNKLHYLNVHGGHLPSHLTAPHTPQVGEDGRKHLLVPKGGMSRLAEALVPDTGMHVFDDHYLCGDKEVTEKEVMKKTFAIAAISWMAPQSLRHSMKTWQDNGLLDVADEKMIFLNSPQAADRQIASDFDFDVYTTEEYNGNIKAGPSLAYLVGNSSADYILLMEKDFALTSSREVMMREMYTGIQMLARGVDVYR